MKYLIIILVIVALFILLRRENFDISNNLNLLAGDIRYNAKPKFINIESNYINDEETPNQVEFNKKLNITNLQKLKAINKILERIMEVHKNINFNEALLPITQFKPDKNRLEVINNYIREKLLFYSGNQYDLKTGNIGNAFGYETEDQYNILYNMVCQVDELIFKIGIDLIIVKATSTNETILSFRDLSIINNDIYITPNGRDDEYAEIK